MARKSVIMPARIIVIVACISLGALSGCPRNGADYQIEPIKPQRSPDVTVDGRLFKASGRLVKASDDFGFRLYRELAKTDAARNIFIAPLSIELALAMTYNGAEGTTKDAMAETLGLQAMTLDEINQANAQLMTLLRNPDPKVELAIANSLWGQQDVTFNPDFLQRNTDYYNAEVRSLDFALPMSADTINRWVSEKTRGIIPYVVDHDMIREATLVLVNALYFNGQWTVPFDKTQTKDGPFTLADGTTKTLPMMHRWGWFQYFETDDFQSVILPYGDERVGSVNGPYGEGRVRMLIFLPKVGTTLDELATSLTGKRWDQCMGRYSWEEGTLSLPRFGADYYADLKAALIALGMGVAFSPARADFSGMMEHDPDTLDWALFLVIHKTRVDVDEEGTVAAAATVAAGGPPAPPFTMVVDHPFFMAIQDRPTGAILFLGTIVDPQ
ncbi:MAG: serpin family protein [Armatimonadetes bacterium]|nr:serpin family protein [Armatimonadota bacterium]